MIRVKNLLFQNNIRICAGTALKLLFDLKRLHLQKCYVLFFSTSYPGLFLKKWVFEGKALGTRLFFSVEYFTAQEALTFFGIAILVLFLLRCCFQDHAQLRGRPFDF